MIRSIQKLPPSIQNLNPHHNGSDSHRATPTSNLFHTVAHWPYGDRGQLENFILSHVLCCSIRMTTITANFLAIISLLVSEQLF